MKGGPVKHWGKVVEMKKIKINFYQFLIKKLLDPHSFNNLFII